MGRVYPRLRGGSVCVIALLQSQQGLSPPTRGILRMEAAATAQAGSIPAYAGDPARSARERRLCPVYPRLRGGSNAAKRSAAQGKGLSPPTRGIRVRWVEDYIAGRSIPAYAGDPDSLL